MEVSGAGKGAKIMVGGGEKVFRVGKWRRKRFLHCI